MQWRMGAIAVLFLGGILTGCGEDEALPRWVAGPVSGLLLECTQAREPAPKPADLVTRIDLDGDGAPDFVIDTAKGCPALRALYCSNEGCSIDVLTSTEASAFGLHVKARTWEVAERAGRKALVVRRSGDDCAAQPAATCIETWLWSGKEFERAPR